MIATKHDTSCLSGAISKIASLPQIELTISDGNDLLEVDEHLIDHKFSVREERHLSSIYLIRSLIKF